MHEINSEQAKEIKQVVKWQIIAVLLAALAAGLIAGDYLAVLFGGLLVMVSTWHVHRSVYRSEGDRKVLLKLAGLRFAAILLVLGMAVAVLKMQALYMVAGMLVAYIAMYARSLKLIFEQMKGDSRE